MSDPPGITGAVARTLQALRTERGWSLDQLVVRSGVSKGVLVALEQGRSNPSLGTLARISDAFGVPVTRLVEVSDEPGVPLFPGCAVAGAAEHLGPQFPERTAALLAILICGRMGHLHDAAAGQIGQGRVCQGRVSQGRVWGLVDTLVSFGVGFDLSDRRLQGPLRGEDVGLIQPVAGTAHFRDEGDARTVVQAPARRAGVRVEPVHRLRYNGIIVSHPGDECRSFCGSWLACWGGNYRKIKAALAPRRPETAARRRRPALQFAPLRQKTPIPSH